MIELRLLNKQGLEDFIQSPEFGQMPVLPISRHRAVSHIRNPRAADDDILLLLAYKENKLVGYLGVLPDHLFPSQHEKVKFGWLSCIWVDANARGGGIARKLVEKALEKWEYKILATEFVPAIRVLYERTNAFHHSVILKGIRLYVRLDLQTLLPPKKAAFHQLKPLLKLADAAANIAIDLKNRFTAIPGTAYKTAFVPAVDTEAADFINSLQGRPLFMRGASELNWFLENPWVIKKYEADTDSHRYYFSATDNSFEFHCLKAWNEQGELAAFLMFSKRNRILKLPYCYMRPDAIAAVTAIVLRQLQEWKINTFTTFHPELVAHLRSVSTNTIYKKEVQREILISDPLHALMPDLHFEIQTGDGDCVFT